VPLPDSVPVSGRAYVLTDRLNKLVAAGLMEKRPYKEDGVRARVSYHPTDAGTQLKIVLAALQQWGDDNIPPEGGVTVSRRSRASDRPVRMAFVDDRGDVHGVSDIAFDRTAQYPV